MEFYYCKSKWEHAVISAKTSGRAKRAFLKMINERLEDDKKLSFKDVEVSIIGVYLDEGDEDDG
jgi:hypothetical protein